MQFTGKITEVKPVKTGTGQKGEWASVEFEVTETNAQNPTYPQVGGFSQFKNGEHIKFVKDFATMYPLGTEVTVEFNLKCTNYTGKDGTPKKFYKTEAWKVSKVSGETQQAPEVAEYPTEDINPDDIPF